MIIRTGYPGFIFKPADAPEKPERLKESSEALNGSENRLGKELRSAVAEAGRSSVPEVFRDMVAGSPERHTSISTEKGKSKFNEIFAEFESVQPVNEEIRDMKFSPEARESLRLLHMTFEERRNAFSPGNSDEFLRLYGLIRGVSPEQFEQFRQITPEILYMNMIKSGPNCYAYIMGCRTHLDRSPYWDRPWPGDIARGKPADKAEFGKRRRLAKDRDSEPFRKYMEEGMKEDCKAMGCELLKEVDGVKVSASYKPKDDERLVVLLREIKPGNGSTYDYHFMLHEKDGTWTHKPGLFRAANVDDAGKIIMNPESCETDYDELLGYYVIRPLAVKA